MGRHLAGVVGGIDLAYVSPAQRAQQTWDHLSQGLGDVPEVLTDERIYEAWGQDLVSLVGGLPAEPRTVLIVGHEPAMSELVLLLADREDMALRQRVATKYPTCAAAVLEHVGDWADLRHGSARLATFVTPKELRGGQARASRA